MKKKIKWTSHAISRLGLATDKEISNIVGCSQECVRKKRISLQIPAMPKPSMFGIPSTVNGKRNPEWTREYSKTEKRKKHNRDGSKRFRLTQKGIEYHRNYQKVFNKTEKGLAIKKKRREKMIESGSLIPSSMVKCLECGCLFEKMSAIISGFRFIGKSSVKGVCGDCDIL